MADCRASGRAQFETVGDSGRPPLPALTNLEIVSGHTGRVLGRAERLRLLKPYLQSFELRLLQQLGWLERVGQCLPIGSDVLRNSVGGMGAIYTQAVVTYHDIGEHSSIADACRWFADETPASTDPETEEAPLDALTPVPQCDAETWISPSSRDIHARRG